MWIDSPFGSSTSRAIWRTAISGVSALALFFSPNWLQAEHLKRSLALYLVDRCECVVDHLIKLSARKQMRAFPKMSIALNPVGSQTHWSSICTVILHCFKDWLILFYQNTSATFKWVLRCYTMCLYTWWNNSELFICRTEDCRDRVLTLSYIGATVFHILLTCKLNNLPHLGQCPRPVYSLSHCYMQTQCISLSLTHTHTLPLNHIHPLPINGFSSRGGVSIPWCTVMEPPGGLWLAWITEHPSEMVASCL